MEGQDQEEDAAVIKSINNELQSYYQELVDLYRPDLRDETRAKVPPCDPIFPDLRPYNFPKNYLELSPTEKETDHRRVRVADLLTTKLDEDFKLPQRLLLVGQPESGKTALFALLLYYWLHDKTKVEGLDKIDVLVGIQCLSLDSSQGGSELKLEEEVLARLPNTNRDHGEEKIRTVLKRAEILVLIDSLDRVSGQSATFNEISLSPWQDKRVVIFSRFKFLKESEPSHPLRLQQSEKNLVLRLWGGITTNRFKRLDQSPESLSDLAGGLSGQHLKLYCMRLCEVKSMKFEDFWAALKHQLKYFQLEMRKPYNIYMYFQEYCNKNEINIKTPSELYGTWYDACSKSYMASNIQLPDPGFLIINATIQLSKLAYDAFYTGQDYITDENPSKMKFFSHILVPHYDATGKLQRFTFRVAAHQNFLTAKHIVFQMSHNLSSIEKLIPEAAFNKFASVLPMTLGLAQSSQYDTIKKHVCNLAKLIMTDEVTESFRDPIINYAIEIMSESSLYNHTDDSFTKDILNIMNDNNWSILDGNLNPEALKALCKVGEDKKKPEKLFISFSGLPSEMPGLVDLLEAVRLYDIRIGLEMANSLRGLDKQPLDYVIKALHGRGQASLGKFSGYLKSVELLDSHPATRRIYNLALRIHDHDQYEQLYRISKVSNKLKRVFLRINCDSTLKTKKMKELPESITHLTVYLEGIDDGNASQAMAIWRGIRGKTERKGKELLRFWNTEDKKMNLEGVIMIIEAKLDARQIEIPLKQPITPDQKEKITKKLEEVGIKNITVRLLGDAYYPKEDLK